MQQKKNTIFEMCYGCFFYFVKYYDSYYFM